MKPKLIIVLFLTLLARTAFCHPYQMPVRSTLSNQDVNCLAEDDKGYVWIGTRMGLNRYNGSTFKVYYHSDSLSLANDCVMALLPDTEGRLWVGTTTGLNLIRNGEVDPGVNVACGRVSNIVRKADGDLLIMGRSGLYEYDVDGGVLSLVYQGHSLMGEVVISKDGNIWMYNRKTPYIQILGSDYVQKNTIDTEGYNVNDLYADSDGNVFLATDRGLKYYDTDGNPLKLTAELEKMTAGENVLFVVNGINGNVDIGIQGKGLCYFYENGDRLTKFSRNDTLDDVKKALALVTGKNVFLSRNKTGLEYRYFTSDKRAIKLSEESRDGIIFKFYSTGGDSLLVLNEKSAYLKLLNSRADASEVSIEGFRRSDIITASLQTDRSEYWILKNDNRLGKYRFDGSSLRLLYEREVESTVSLWRCEGEEGIYVLQNNSILHILDNGTARTIQTMHYPEFWHCGTTDSGLTYFIGDEGIWYFDSDKRIKKLPVDIKEPGCLYEDRDGKYWIGSQSSGIYIYDTKTGETENFSVNDGLPDNTTRSIIGDDDGNIWVSSRCQVYVITAGTRQVVLMGNPEDLNFKYNANRCLKTPYGHVIFGGREFISDYASIDESPSNDLTPLFDAIIVGGRDVLNDEESLNLLHKNNNVSFYFSAMNFDPGVKLTYKYKLDGYDNDWVFNGASTSVSYSNLPKGHYTFRVCVQNSTGLWSRNILRYDFRVRPTFWVSTPAILIYIFVILSVLTVLLIQSRHIRRNRKAIEQAEYEKLFAESLSKEKTAYFTNISHEYRTPLSLIYGPLKELSAENSFDQRGQYLLSLVMRNAEKMTKLTDEILTINTHEKESIKVMKSDVSVLLRGLLGSFEYMFRQREIAVTQEIPDGLRAYFDHEVIERVFFNIVSNAVKYTPEGGSVSIKANITDGYLYIMIADTGVGISPEKMRLIFNRFERADADKDTKGFGIGLNYAMQLMKMHHGQILVSPNLPKGTIFTMSIPALKSAYSPEEIMLDTEAQESGAIIPEERQSEMKSTTVLIVEDNMDLANYIKHLLIDKYNVILTANGNEALECLNVSVPDIIVSDVMMPFKDGFELTREIKSSDDLCYIPIILLTAKADVGSQLEGMEIGADAYIKKPFDPVILIKAIENILNNRKRIQGMLIEKTVSPEKEIDVAEVHIKSQDMAFMTRVRDIIEAHIADEEFNVTMMAQEMNISRTSLFTKMKTLYGISPITFMSDYRLNRSMELLKTGEHNVSEVAYMVGFATLTGFSRAFKNKFGVPPSSI